MAVSTSQAKMIGATLELLVMGAYIMMFIYHMKVMYGRRCKSIPYVYLLSTSIIIFVLSLAHTVIGAWRIYTAFTTKMEIPNAPVEFFSHYNSWDSRASTALYDIITLVSDLFFVYRTWIIWNRSYIICVVPFLLFLGDIAMTVYVMWSLTHSSDNPVFAITLIAATSKYFFSVTLALTLVCTFLIAFQLWSIDRHIKPVLSNHAGEFVYRRLSKVVTIIMESAALYSSLLIVMIVTDTLGIQAFFVLLQVIPPVIGLVFSSIIVRSTGPNAGLSRRTATRSLHFRTRNHGDTQTAYTTTVGSGPDGVEIHLETATQTATHTETLRGAREIEKQKYNGQDSV
ncbi:hypothetical protein BDZ94DRAFT_1269575 [Collybia nuda]|uniref:Uncharacterized protein n=1 Tax=Collybia nuda TaxID=64659 RepID=A0A9P5XYF6_9AGAR|nr:hypothetical protein BDZ94DRAFT_1269575 [Collybia nuda]